MLTACVQEDSFFNIGPWTSYSVWGLTCPGICRSNTRGADKSLSRLGRKQARNHVRDARDFNKIETRSVMKFLFLQGKAPKETYAILTETLACFLPGRAKELSAPLYLWLSHVRVFRHQYTRSCIFRDLPAKLDKLLIHWLCVVVSGAGLAQLV